MPHSLNRALFSRRVSTSSQIISCTQHCRMSTGSRKTLAAKPGVLPAAWMKVFPHHLPYSPYSPMFLA